MLALGEEMGPFWGKKLSIRLRLKTWHVFWDKNLSIRFGTKTLASVLGLKT